MHNLVKQGENLAVSQVFPIDSNDRKLIARDSHTTEGGTVIAAEDKYQGTGPFDGPPPARPSLVAIPPAGLLVLTHHEGIANMSGDFAYGIAAINLQAPGRCGFAI